ncbi:MAG: rhodanese-like domain-containing protein [Bacillota bacterium]|jgi:thiosulfate/3-mercaptopyruvate sulfurtransferase
MKTKLFLCLLGSLLMGLVLTSSAGAVRCKFEPIVSTDWLQTHNGQSDLVIIDIRSAEEYETEHIANAVNIPFVVPYSAWSDMRNDLLLELPGESDLFETIGSCGITRNSRVVIVPSGPAEPQYPLAGATRVALTLIYAGIKKVAVLDGGYAKWLAEGKPVTTAVPVISAQTYRGKVNDRIFVSMEYLRGQIGKALIIDARDAAVYNGSVVESYAAKPGHIPTAISLPAVLLWNTDGTNRPTGVLRQAVNDAIGKKDQKEIIIYCGVGGYASSWWYVLTRVLGYRHVKVFDGSAQEWAINYDMEIL